MTGTVASEPGCQLRGSTPSKRQHPRGLAAAQDRPVRPHTGRHAHAGGHKTVRRSLHRARPGLTAQGPGKVVHTACSSVSVR